MHETLQSICIPLVLNAGDILLKNWDEVSIAHMKEGEDICTNLDLQIEEFLLTELEKHFADHNFDGEENGSTDKESDFTWIVDPIDGSKNYIRHLPFFNISIALLHKGEPIFGIVYAPKTEELFYASKGEGAFLLNQQHGEDFSKETTTRLRGGKIAALSKAQLHVELPTTGKDGDQKKYTEDAEYLEKLMKSTYRIRSFGSGAIALCYTARGSYDGYVDLSSSTKWHDLAAGMLIAQEAGLKVGTLDGAPLSDPSAQTLIAAHPEIFSQITQL